MPRGSEQVGGRLRWARQGRLRWWLLGGAVVATVAVVASLLLVPDRSDGRTARATVGADGFSLALAGISVSAPAGVAPEGTTVTARLLDDAPSSAPLPRVPGAAGPGIDVDLGGRQPDEPVTIVFPTEHEYGAVDDAELSEDDLVPLVLTRPGGGDDVHLEPATYDPAAETLTVTVTHLTDFWEWPGKVRDFAAAVIASAITGETAQPSCDAQPVEEPSGRQILLGMPTPRMTWGCMELSGGDVTVTLTNTVPSPLKAQSTRNGTRSTQGTLSPAEAVTIAVVEKLPDYDRHAGLLTQRTQMTYRYPLASLPASITLTAEPAAYLLGALLSMLQTAADLFEVDILADLRRRGDALECLASALPGLTQKLDAHTIGTGLNALFTCAKPVLEGMGIDAGKKLVIVTLLAAGIPLVATGLGGALITAVGPAKVTIRRGPPVLDPCSGSAALGDVVQYAMPRAMDPRYIADVELRGCEEGHIVGRLVPVFETDNSFVVLRPAGDTWKGEVVPIGLECGSTGYPRSVEDLFDCYEAPSLPTDYWELDDICRGTTGPESDAACAARDELTRQAADEAVTAFLAAWAARDRAGLAALTAPEAQGYLPDSVLGNTLREDVPPDCDYDFLSGMHECAVEVEEGDWGIAVRFEHRDDLLWLATFSGPIDVG